jgi:hypothetical protein
MLVLELVFGVGAFSGVETNQIERLWLEWVVDDVAKNKRRDQDGRRVLHT